MTPPRVVCVVQARMGSQRLPGKVLLPLPPGTAEPEDLTILDWVMRRARAAGTIDEVMVATSIHQSDNALADFCSRVGYRCHRGSLDDVLGRMHGAAVEASADVVVRVTADCPLVDPEVIDEVVRAHLEGGQDFTANRLPPPARRSYPVGLDVEVASIKALGIACREANSAAHREHVMPFLYENAERFDVTILHIDTDAGAVRWTVDTPQDLEAVRTLVAVSQATPQTSWRSLLEVWRQHPEIAAINASVEQRTAEVSDPRT